MRRLKIDNDRLAVLNSRNDALIFSSIISSNTENSAEQEDPLQRQPVIDLAERDLGWAPSVALDKVLEPTIAYFHEILDGATLKACRGTRQDGISS